MASRTSAGIRPSVAALLTGIVSIIVTIAGTLISIRSGAPPQTLFLTLAWIMFLSAACGVLIAMRLVLDEMRTERLQLERLKDLDSHVPRIIRFIRREDRFAIRADGDARLLIISEALLDGDASVPWLAFPMLAEIRPAQVPWESIKVVHMEVDGNPVDSTAAFVPRERRTIVNDSYLQDRIVESGLIRVPVSLGPTHRRCRFSVDIRLIGAFTEIDSEEMCYTDVAYVTDELVVTIRGENGLTVGGSPFAAHRVEAMQLGMELLDSPETQLQSAKCAFRQSAVEWRTSDSKLGYRYRIPIRRRQRS